MADEHRRGEVGFEGLAAAFEALRERNRDEHDHLGRDIEQARDGGVALTKLVSDLDAASKHRLTTLEARVERLEERVTTADRKADQRATNFPTWALVALGSAELLLTMLIQLHIIGK